MSHKYKQLEPERQIKLPVPPEFSFKENLKYLSRSSNECLLRIHDNKVYKAIATGTNIYVLEVSEDLESPQTLSVHILGPDVPNSMDRKEIALHVREWFDLDTDLAPFYKMAKQDKILEGAAQQFYGLRNMGIPDLFEAICWGIIGQQINLAFAYTLKRRLVERYGRSILYEGDLYWVFPVPETIASLSVEEMEDLRMTVKKREYLIDVAKLFVNGQLSKESLLLAADCKTAEKMLVKIRGIGPWTANYVLMRCLRYASAFPIDDVGLHNAIKHVLQAEEKPTKEELRQLSSGWTNWESYATFYLWRLLY
ncbi:DNA-3-methyladenine glycosylase 2 [Paenibacillus dakarensis]|uniref:DNA-3-methyladenine glycosylase 2 n=1 Tax=Paenibacillus dakarensis TaxID=1527293 RepID=UPI0006D54041|nr:DNA-3-methyladenine glycosylase 2 [Paenibacillus dakarensis]